MVFSIILSFLSSFEANSVFVIVGAIALTLILGAKSAATDFVSPSIADLAVATLAWKGIPRDVATVLNKTIDPDSLFDRAGIKAWIALIAPITLISKSFLKSSNVNLLKGFRLMLPRNW